MFQYSENIFFKNPKKKEFCGVEKDPSVTISGLQKSKVWS